MLVNIFVEGRPDLSHSLGSFHFSRSSITSWRLQPGTRRVDTDGLNLAIRLPLIVFDCLERVQSDYFFSGPSLGVAFERNGLAAYESDGTYDHHVTELQLKFKTDLEGREVRIHADGKLVPADPQPGGGRVPDPLPGFRLEACIAFSEMGQVIEISNNNKEQEIVDRCLAKLAAREGKEDYLARALNITA